MLQRAWVRSLLIMVVILATGYACAAQISITVAFAPPELPVYEQPPCPGDDYIWTPGYWAWDADYDDYYWVPGTWILAPEPGYFWTPPYWAWEPGGYVFYPGYWGPQVGFYGGIDYGYGYFGRGYDGGRWEHGHFFYNREVNNVNVTVVHNVYNTRVEERNVNVARVSYNGGNGGVNARPTPEEQNIRSERHIAATPAQTRHFQEARSNTQFRASVNHGKPPVAATDKPAEFSGKNVVAARSGGNYTPPPNRGHNAGGSPAASANHPGNPPAHVKELPPMRRPEAPNTGNPKLDQKYAQQQNKLYEKQNQERQKLEQKQEQEHQKFAQQQANEARKQQQAAPRQQQERQMQQHQQQMEQRHQQQTQQMQQRHAEQQQRLQQRQAPPSSHNNAPPEQKPHH